MVLLDSARKLGLALSVNKKEKHYPTTEDRMTTTIKKVSILIIILAWAGQLIAEDPVDIPDAVLKAAIEEKLQILDPTPTDMRDLTSLRNIMGFSAQSQGIDDLTGLEYATNLQHLDLRLNQITDLSPLSDLVNMQVLNLSQNKIDDLSPLSGLTDLVDLNVHANQIDDLSPLSDLTRLQELDLHLNQISDLSPLDSLINLETLILFENHISSLSTLEGLSLSELDVRMNPLDEDAYSDELPSLASDNPGIDLYYSENYDTSVRVTASRGLYSNRVRVSWDEIHGGPNYPSYYQVSRSLTNQPATKIPISDWKTSLSHDDTSAELGTHYYYWVDVATDMRGGDKESFNQGIPSKGWVSESAIEDTPEIDETLLTVLYVDDDAPGDALPEDASTSDPNEDGTKNHPFDSIQEAIDVANQDSMVLVRPGTYYERLNLMGKNIHLTSFDPEATDITPYPVIDANISGTVVTFNHFEDANCQLSGFVLTGGVGPQAGAIACIGSSPVIRNCLIVGNRSYDSDSAGIYCINSASAIINCTVSGNDGGQYGAGIHLVDSSSVVRNSIISGNSPQNILGTGLDTSTYEYSYVGSAPLFAMPGAWIEVYDNVMIDNPPFVTDIWMGGDYHLLSQGGRYNTHSMEWLLDVITSRSIDAGDPASPIGGESLPHGNRINMGAYGGTPHASHSIPPEAGY
jgi:hypothetical protein